MHVFHVRVHLTLEHVLSSLCSPVQLLTGICRSTTWLRQVRVLCWTPVSHVTLHVLQADQSDQPTVCKFVNIRLYIPIEYNT